MREKTLQEKFWLTQRLTVKEEGTFSMDYMGAAEFEWGAPKEAFKKLAMLAERGYLVQKDIVVEDWKKVPVPVTAIYEQGLEIPNTLTITESKETPYFSAPAPTYNKKEKPEGFRYHAWVPCENNFNMNENWMYQPGIILIRKEDRVFAALDSLLKFWAKNCVEKKLIKKALPETFSSKEIRSVK